MEDIFHEILHKWFETKRSLLGGEKAKEEDLEPFESYAENIVLRLEKCLLYKDLRSASQLFDEVLDRYQNTKKEYFYAFHTSLPKKNEYFLQLKDEIRGYKRKIRHATF